MGVRIILALTQIIRVLELVDSANLSFADENRVGSNPSSDKFFYIFLNKLYTNVLDIKEPIKYLAL
jgi:hypothetical protein